MLVFVVIPDVALRLSVLFLSSPFYWLLGQNFFYYLHRYVISMQLTLPDPYGEDDQHHMMHPYAQRTPSPGHPVNGYQLSDNPYAPQGHLEMPSSDRLAEQPTVGCLSPVPGTQC